MTKMKYTKLNRSISMRLVLATLFLNVIVGCATMSYQYNGKTYPTRGAAEAAQQSRVREYVDFIQPRKTPIGNELKIYIPNMEVTLNKGVRTKDHSSDAAQYVATSLREDWLGLAKMVEKRNIFRTTSILSSDASHITNVEAGQSVIYLYGADENTWGWYYISNNIARTPLTFDTGNPDKIEGTYFFVESVEALAATEY